MQRTQPQRKKIMDWYMEQNPIVQIAILYGVYRVGKSVVSSVVGLGGTDKPFIYGDKGSGLPGYQSANFYNYQQDAAAQQAAGIKLTYPKSQYSIFADTLEEAFEYMGTDQEAIESVFSKMMNDADVTELIKAYGVRANSFIGWANDYTLPQLITSELQRGEIQTYINKPLEKNGVNFRF